MDILSKVYYEANILYYEANIANIDNLKGEIVDLLRHEDYAYEA